MKKLILIAGGMVVLIAIVLFIQAPQGTSPSPQPSSVQASRYLPYSQDSFDRATDKRRVLYFHADWCSVCRPLDQEFSARQQEIPEDVILYKANYDTETALKKKYAITYQHTFVQVDAQDEEVATWSGGGIQELKTNLK